MAKLVDEEAVALRRLNDRDATIAPMVAVDARSTLGPAEALAQDRVYLTPQNWVAYVDAVKALGKLTQTQRDSFAGMVFNDATVTSLIQTAFAQTLRTDISVPISDGLTMTRTGQTATYSVNIDQVQDDSGFYLPKAVTISAVETINIVVPNSYVTGRDAASVYTVKYDVVTGLNSLGIWFGGFENVELNVNAATTGDRADTITINPTRYIDNLTVNTGDGADRVIITSTASTTLNVNTGSGADTVVLMQSKGETTISTGDGADRLYVNHTNAGVVMDRNGIVGILHLIGGSGADDYIVGMMGNGRAQINIVELVSSDVDTLTIEGSRFADMFLFRRHSISSVEINAQGQFVLNGGATRLAYPAGFGSILVNGNDGNDFFILDDTSAVLDIRGGRGDDTFQIGQVFKSKRDADANIANPEDYFDTILTTQGFLSNGISRPASLYGGDGKDTFTVYRNLAELSLYGEADDDNFFVRSFVRVDPNDRNAPKTNINGGQGADFISYTLNAPVNISGGDGLDTLTVVGTEFGEDFVVTEDGIYGGGLAISYDGIENLVLDAMAGNDTFFIAGTRADVAVTLIGGLGSDTFNIGGGNVDANGKEIPIAVVSNDLRGHSGLIRHNISTSGGTNPLYVDVTAPDLSVNVNDNEEPAVVILNGNQNLRIFEEVTAAVQSLMLASYFIVLSRAPAESVRVSAVPTRKGSTATLTGIAVNGSASGAVLTFDETNWFIPQEVTVTAYNDTVAEGTELFEIKHSAIEGTFAGDGDAYDNLQIRRVMVEVVDNDQPGVQIMKSGDSDQVIEGGANDTYFVMLTAAPTNDVTITVAADGQVQFESAVSGTFANTRTLTFTSTNWNTPQTVTVKAFDDTVKEGKHFSRITHTVLGTGNYAGVKAGSVDMTIIDNDVLGILITQTKGSTDVTEITTTVPIGGGQVLTNPNSTTVTGTFGTGLSGSSILPEAKDNDSYGSAQNIDLGKWSESANPNISAATTIPHITVQATGEGRSDYFSFTVTAAELAAANGSLKVNIDIDQTSQNVYWLGALTLERTGTGDFAYALPNFPQWGWSHDTYVTGSLTRQTPATGLDTDADASLAVNITTAGTYTIQISDRYYYGVPAGATYDLHVSREGHAADTLTFKPSPVLEQEADSSSLAGQNIGAEAGWYTLHNPDIGDSDGTGGEFDSSASYTMIQGYGDGTVDKYTFTIVAADLKKPGGTTANETVNAGTYYLSATMTMAGPVDVGDQWVIAVDGMTYTYTVAPGDTITQVANGLKALIPAKYTATVVTGTPTTLSLADSTGFTLASPYINHVNPAVINSAAGSGTTLFHNMAMNFSGTTTGSTQWQVVLDGTAYSTTPTASVTTTVTALRAAINLSGIYSATGTGTQILISRINSAVFAGVFRQSGLSPDGRVTISGNPDASTRAAARWTSATIDITAAHNNETLNIVINGTTYNATGSTNVSTLISRITTTLASSGVTVNSTASTVTLSHAAGFTLDYSVTAAPAAGDIALSTATWTAANLQLGIVSGRSFNASDTYKIVVDGSTYTAKENTQTLVGNDLRDQLNATLSFAATYNSATQTLSVRKIGATAPNVTASVVAQVNSSTSTADGGTGIRQLSITGTITPGETFNVVLGGSTPVPGYVAVDGDTPTTIATALAGLINSVTGYTATPSGSTIDIDDTNSTNRPAVACTIVAASSSDATVTTLATSSGNVAYADLSGSVIDDEVWTLTVAGVVPAVYTVDGNSSTLANVATGLMSIINSGGLYSARYSAGRLTVVRLDSATIDATESVVMPVSVPMNTSAGTLHEDWSTTVGSLDAFVADDVFTLQLTTETGKTRRRDSMSDVVDALVAHARQAGWDATATTTGTGNVPTIRLQSLNGSTVQFEEGNGTIFGLLDIDRYIDAVGGATRTDGLHVRLLDPNDNEVVLTDSAGSDVDSDINPLKTFSINTVGTYKIQVYAPGATLPDMNGVPAGTLYRLNVSLPGHAVSANQVNLEGKTMTFNYTDTNGVDQTAERTIESYDPETSTYTLTSALPASMPVGTRFTIGFDIATVYPQYITNPASSEARIDTYTIVLTAAPDAGETVRVDLSGIATRTYNSKLAFSAGNGEHNDPQVGTDVNFLAFTASNWNIPQSVRVTAVNDNYADGQDAQVFDSMEQRVNRIRGPVLIEGGNRIGAEQFLNNPVMLPGETNFQLEDGSITAVSTGDPQFTDTSIKHFDPQTKAQVGGFDPRMNDYSQSPVDEAMTLTTDRLTGMGMGPDTIIGGEMFRGGIGHKGLEAVNIHLGTGSQNVTIESTHTGETSIISGKGDDTIRIKTISGRTYVHTGTGKDAVNITGDDTTIDQITGLLTVAADGIADTLTIDDSADDNNNSGILTATTLTGLDMPSVAEVQTMRVQATGGSFKLAATDLSTSETLQFGASAAEVATALTSLFAGSPYNAVAGDIVVTRVADGQNAYFYKVTIGTHRAGRDMPTLVWIDEVAPNGLTFTTEISRDVAISTVVDGTTAPVRNNVQTLTVSATTGTFSFELLGTAVTIDVAHATKSILEQLREQMNAILNPNNAASFLPHTSNYSLHQIGNTFEIVFRDNQSATSIASLNTALLTGSAVLQIRTSGINYYGFSKFNLTLGSGNDSLNIQGTAPSTTNNINTAAGNDQIDMLSMAALSGTTDLIAGNVNLDAGSGTNQLLISDFADTTGDTNITLIRSTGPTITTETLTLSGIADGDIRFSATGGDFNQGVTIFGGPGGNTFTIGAVFAGAPTLIGTGAGDDHLTPTATTRSTLVMVTTS